MTRFFVLVCLVGLWLVDSGCAGHASDPEESTGAEPDSLIHVSRASLASGEIATESLRSRPLADTLSLNGEIRPNPLSVAHVSTRVSGTIQNVRVVVGDRVGRDQPLATLYSPEFLAVAGDFVLAHERAENAAQNHSPDAPSLEAVAQSSQRRLEMLGAPASLVARLQASHEVANELPLLSPRSGLLTEVNAASGKHVEAGTDLFDVTDLSRVWAVTHAYERDLGRLSTGQVAEVVANAYPGRSFAGRVASLQGAVNETTRTLEVRLDVTNPGLVLRPGMFVTARIATGRVRDALVLSEGAVQGLTQTQVVFVAISDTTFVARSVTTRPLGGNQVEVLTGVRSGERVATTGAFLLKSQAMKGELGEEE